MGIISSYADDASTSDTDRFLTYASDGSTKLSPASNLKTYLGFTTNPGGSWASLANTPNSITASGNRSYNMVFNAVDLTSALSPGMRLRTQRTVAAPTQCTSLNGSTQFYSKTSPSGMTFTTAFTQMAWVKLSAYSASSQVITSRYNGSSGFRMFIKSTGQLAAYGYSSPNYRGAYSYQSIPVGKWVHVAVAGDVSTNTWSMYIDGIAVPANLDASGSPTTITQAGNLEIGSSNAGTEPFGGKIAQAALFSAAISQATIQSYISQGLAGTETSLVSAYSFNNSINDLNANTNNLTANGSAVATNADSPFGGQADGTVSSTLDYAIVTKTAFSTNTTLTVQVPEGCTIPTSGGVSAVSYATVKAPYGMPANKYKWGIEFKYKVTVSQAVTSTSAWLNVTGIQFPSLPLGDWDVDCSARAAATATSTAFVGSYFTISTGTTTQSNDELTGCTTSANVSTGEMDAPIAIKGLLSNAAQTTWYLNAQPNAVNGTTTSYILAGTQPAYFRFFPASLML